MYYVHVNLVRRVILTDRHCDKMSTATATAPTPTPTTTTTNDTKPQDKAKTVNVKKEVKKKTKTAVDELTAEEREAVTIVFHQFETGLREGTIFTKVEFL